MVLSFFAAIVPIIWLIVALAFLKIRAHGACLSALALSLVFAIVWRNMDALCAATAVLEGVLNALWPICLVIIAALFTYNITVFTKAMDTIKSTLCSVSCDQRVLALVIIWGFGGFMEGMAGFGTAVAIPAALMVGIGVNPVSAIVGCLVVNAMPTSFGSAGIPTTVLSSVSGVDALSLSGDIALLAGLLMFVSPFFLVAVVGGGIKALKGMVPATTVASALFLIPWFAMAQVAGPELPNIVGSVCSMAGLVLYMRLRKPALDPAYALRISGGVQEAVGFSKALRAWSPFVLVLALLLLTSTLCPPVRNVLLTATSVVSVYCGENPNTLTFNWVATPGVMIFAAAFIGGAIQGARARDFAEVLKNTFVSYWKTIVTICSILAMAKVMGYSGMIDIIAQTLVALAGPAFPLIAPLIGALGGFVTGSGTSSNILFGSLQAQTAASLGMDVSWITASNAAGAGIGKMICPQSISIGMSAAGQEKIESTLMRRVFGYFALYCAVVSLACMAGSLL